VSGTISGAAKRFPAPWRLLFALSALLVACLATPAPPTACADESPADIEVFVREGCPHCAAAKLFLQDLRRERPGLRIVIRDVAQDPAARARLNELGRLTGTPVGGVPAFYLRGRLLVGFRDAETTGRQLAALLDQPAPSSAEPDSVETRWFGRLSARELGLPAFTLAIGLLDGFNPCAMWVLLFLLSLLVNLHDRLKMALIAGTFVLVSGAVYFAFMAAWLNVFLLIGLSRPVQLLLGGIAGLMGALNVKDFFALGRGVSLGIPESAKPELYARVRRVLAAEDLTGALAGIVALAVLVNTIELLCTAGFPAAYTQILTLRQLPWWEYYGYLALYNIAYIFDDSVMVTIAVITLGRRKLQEREGRWLKLVSGLVMLALGLALLARPQWLL
jgi:glutaredoxin